MFNIYASLAVILALIAVYAIIRIKHGGPLLSSSHTWPEWVVAFRSWVAMFLAGIATAAPDILVKLAPVDFSTVLPQPWGSFTAGALALFLAINNALKTKPDGQAA